MYAGAILTGRGRFFGGDQMAEHSEASIDVAMKGTSTWQEDGYWRQLWLHDVHYHLLRDLHGELTLMATEAVTGVQQMVTLQQASLQR